ncbi:response regulator transcription factor [Elizabethkingia meningoseptica]|uniref:response regulator transcription factor n=1 Tax=Elizabethkingia meningoseptica TaxID=238 RepID=UPI0023B11DF0|nr:response regulator transcription factor [Elizabethkingia meningoseptica]MDE5439325.1 response regulator transcription factor [Elizabethkingia meningoseptica]MDE5510035.1 response regulator transcription factor [Elizabethkingia meningoseptica]MDE5517061.1 response regulator transcription factor [Elizabethkingia meningoseptica]MDE5531301.1 response regulator transcription factor [Elizabethkingia meningoseptica]MDE5534860.1 response regulator transcription factor [Elizabethkingia meningoseptic
MNILLIEDEVGVSNFIKKGLEESQYHVILAYEGVMGLQLAKEQDFDLIILDVILPQMNGFEICSEIKRFKPEVPVLMLTALSTIQDKLKGFDQGADDYLTKPFHFEELLARINALSRRNQTLLPVLNYTADDLVMDCYKKVVKRNGEEITLTVKEYSLLEYLLVNKNRVITRAKIAEAVWGIGFNRGTNLIDVYINYLRTKIDKGYSKQLIHTVVGMGYILKDE